jgi:hypothetical protein
MKQGINANSHVEAYANVQTCTNSLEREREREREREEGSKWSPQSCDETCVGHDVNYSSTPVEGVTFFVSIAVAVFACFCVCLVNKVCL